MKVLRIVVALLPLAWWGSLSAQTSPSPEALLKAAINREVVDRDFAGAAAQYRDIAARFAANHGVAARALLQLGDLYERLGSEDARPTYQRILSDYPDTGATVRAARARLAAIQQAAAGPFKMRDLDAWVAGAEEASVSPDGRHFIHSRVRTQASGAAAPVSTLYLREMPSGRERVLLEGPDFGRTFRQVTWAPDGRRVAVVAYVTPSVWEARVITAANRQMRAFAKGTGRPTTFSWSPDSRRLAYVVRSPDAPTAELRVAIFDPPASDDIVDRFPLPFSEPTMVVAWAADSNRLAFAVQGTATADTIRVVTLGAPAVAQIPFAKARPNSRTGVPRWTPAGEMEVVQSVPGGNDFFLLNPATGAFRLICEGRGASGGDGCGPGRSPDGRWLVTRKNLSEDGRAYLRSTADGSERPLTTEAVREAVIGFSPDSRLVAFKSNREGQWGVYVAPVDAIPVHQPTRIASMDTEGAARATWTPTTGLVIRVDHDQTNQYRVDVDPRTQRPTGFPVRLTHDAPVNDQAFPSPDGRRIAYISRSFRDRPAGFAVMDISGSRERVVKAVATDMILRMELIGWVSADEIAYADAGLGSTPQPRVPRTITVLNVTTGAARQLPGTVTGSDLQIVGETLFYSERGERAQLHTRPVAGGAGRLATTLPDDWWNRALSRDGRLLAYSTVQGDGRDQPGELRLRSLETGTDSVLARYENSNGNHAPLDLSTDGRFLVYRDVDLRLRVMNVETRESWPLVTTPPAGISFGYAPARWSPDGSYVVVEGYSSRTTLRAYDGVTYDAVRRLTGGGR